MSGGDMLLEWLRTAIEKIMRDIFSDISAGKRESRCVYESPFGTISVSVRIVEEGE